MEKFELHRHSDLFSLRIWLEEIEDNHHEWRGLVEHVISGEKLYFRSWSTLITFLQKSRAGPERQEWEA